MIDYKALIVAIDGPAGAGKSTVAATVARRLGLPYLDTGAMYRAVGLFAIRDGISPPFDRADIDKLAEFLGGNRLSVEVHDSVSRVTVDGEDVSHLIRTPECSEMASAVSEISEVRRALVPLQRRIGTLRGGVMEGRDIGTVVFPDAHVKIYLTASENERARRRLRDQVDAGVEIDFESVLKQQQARDERDSSREDSPLTVADGARVIDSSGMTLDEVVDSVLAEVENSLDSHVLEHVRSRNY